VIGVVVREEFAGKALHEPLVGHLDAHLNPVRHDHPRHVRMIDVVFRPGNDPVVGGQHLAHGRRDIGPNRHI